MKKIAFLLSGLLLFSCGSDDEKIDPVEQQEEFNKKAVVGKWVSFAYDVAYKGRFEVTSHDTLYFTSNGTYRMVHEGKPDLALNGTYEINDMYLTLSTPRTYQVWFDADTMSLKEYGFGADDRNTHYVRLE